jgi:hypothetical protein
VCRTIGTIAGTGKKLTDDERCENCNEGGNPLNGSVILLLVIVVTAFVSGNNGTDTVRMSDIRTGRKIMHDGFLMEWSLKDAVPWGSDSSWMYDVMATPEGLAGYFRTGTAEPCSSRTLLFSVGSAEPVRVTLPPDSGRLNEMIKIDTSGSGAGSAYTIEWLCRWPAGFNLLTTPFTVAVDRECRSGYRFPTLFFEYRHKKEKPDGTGSLVGRILLIGGLGALYLMVQRKIRNQTKQRGSPHQSA